MVYIIHRDDDTHELHRYPLSCLLRMLPQFIHFCRDLGFENHSFPELPVSCLPLILMMIAFSISYPGSSGLLPVKISWYIAYRSMEFALSEISYPGLSSFCASTLISSFTRSGSFFPGRRRYHAVVGSVPGERGFTCSIPRTTRQNV